MEVILQVYFLNSFYKFHILINSGEIGLSWILQDSTDDRSTLVQGIAGNKPLP